jgi:hypothetical protein
MTGRLAAAVVVLATLALAAGPAAAQGSDEAEGRKRWHHGQELYDQGRYLDAAHEFEAGYALAPRPLFFLSIGHAYRKAHELEKAKVAYEKLLTLQPDFAGRAEIEGYIKSINDALQVAEPSSPTNAPGRPAAPPTVLAPGPAAPPSPAPVSPSESSLSANAPYGPPGASAPPAPTLLETSQPGMPGGDETRSPSVLRKPWFWVIVGAVVAGSIAAAVIASHPSSSCPGTLCIRETRE